MGSLELVVLDDVFEIVILFLKIIASVKLHYFLVWDFLKTVLIFSVIKNWNEASGKKAV